MGQWNDRPTVWWSKCDLILGHINLSSLGKIDYNSVSPKMILHNQSHDIVELMKSNSLLETDRRKSHSLSARQLRRLFFLTQFAESVFFSSPEAFQTKELLAQWVKTLFKMYSFSSTYLFVCLARQLRQLFFLMQFAESVFFSSSEACQTKEAQWVKTLFKMYSRDGARSENLGGKQ